MEYKRSHALSRRKAPRRALRASAVSLLLLLVVCGIVVFAFSTSQAADWLSEHIFLPLSGKNATDAEEKTVSAMQKGTAPTVPPTPTATPEAKTVSLTLAKKSYYLLQMGCFDTQQQAAEASSDLQNMGAAGYVFFDGTLYRVFAASYGSSADLVNVQNRVRLDGFENSAYILHANALKIEAGGEETVVNGIQSAAIWLQQLPDLLTEYAVTVDRDKVTVRDAAGQIRNWHEETEKLKTGLDTVKNEASVAPILSALSDYSDYLSTFPDANATISALELSSELKALQIRTIVRYYQMTGKGNDPF